MIGASQWLITLGRFDIATAVATLSRFRVAPRQGYLDRLKCIYGYIRSQPNGTICIRTEEPDYSQLVDVEYDWMYSVYGDVCELLPEDAPTPLGKPIVITTYVDANLYHCLLTGCANTMPTPVQQDAHRLVHETTSYGRDGDLWFQVCFGMPNS